MPLNGEGEILPNDEITDKQQRYDEEIQQIFNNMLAAVFALTSCTQDELADNNTLPEGLYPLEIASATLTVESSKQPWTHVSGMRTAGAACGKRAMSSTPSPQGPRKQEHSK